MGGGELSVIKKTIENTLANIPGIICDGAKISCAAKIAASLDAAFLAHHLAMNGQSYAPYTGILKEEAGESHQLCRTDRQRRNERNRQRNSADYVRACLIL